MRSPAWYIDEAKKRSGIQSDRKFSAFIGQSPNWVSQIKTGRALPSDDAMMKMAPLAGVQPWQALLDLCVWRTNGQTRAVYEDLQKKILPAILIALTALSILGSRPALAADQVSSYGNDTVYYGIYDISI